MTGLESKLGKGVLWVTHFIWSHYGLSDTIQRARGRTHSIVTLAETKAGGGQLVPADPGSGLGGPGGGSICLVWLWSGLPRSRPAGARGARGGVAAEASASRSRGAGSGGAQPGDPAPPPGRRPQPPPPPPACRRPRRARAGHVAASVTPSLTLTHPRELYLVLLPRPTTRALGSLLVPARRAATPSIQPPPHHPRRRGPSASCRFSSYLPRVLRHSPPDPSLEPLLLLSGRGNGRSDTRTVMTR